MSGEGTLDGYQLAAKRTDAKNAFVNERERLACWALGLTGEAGEYADLIKKHLFHGRALDKEKALKELGDTLWYLSMAAEAHGFLLSEVAAANLAKLRLRYPDGFTHEASAARVDEQETAKRAMNAAHGRPSQEWENGDADEYEEPEAAYGSGCPVCGRHADDVHQEGCPLRKCEPTRHVGPVHVSGSRVECETCGARDIIGGGA